VDARGRRGVAIVRPGDHMTQNLILDRGVVDRVGERP
jgi:hypothetical protein